LPPQGPWCPIDYAGCGTAYGTKKTPNNQTLFFDYCEEVREQTVEGCLCMPTWNKPGGGKKYPGTCANPDQSAQRWCIVDINTCPEEIAGNRGTCKSVEPEVGACCTMCQGSAARMRTYKEPAASRAAAVL
jgi:hypothetical protein